MTCILSGESAGTKFRQRTFSLPMCVIMGGFWTYKGGAFPWLANVGFGVSVRFCGRPMVAPTVLKYNSAQTKIRRKPTKEVFFLTYSLFTFHSSFFPLLQTKHPDRPLTRLYRGLLFIYIKTVLRYTPILYHAHPPSKFRKLRTAS